MTCYPANRPNLLNTPICSHIAFPWYASHEPADIALVVTGLPNDPSDMKSWVLNPVAEQSFLVTDA